jgi:Flp pilus assembly protein TadG
MVTAVSRCKVSCKASPLSCMPTKVLTAPSTTVPVHARGATVSHTPRRKRHERSRRGQALVEFALILPLLLVLVGGIIQYGVIFATKHSLIQVGRDAGRWAATQDSDPCSSAALTAPLQPLTEADVIAQQSRLMGYSAGDWNAGTFTAYPDNSALPATPPSTEGVEVVWSHVNGEPCPTVDSTTAAYVTIRLSHRAPVLLPGIQFLPALGTCDGSGCYLAVSTTARFRMEPTAGP